MTTLVRTPSVEEQQAYIPGGHLNFLDGIRALAALFVVMHHVWLFEFGSGARKGFWGGLTNWLLYGHLAVDIFIVLSGFCLVLPVVRKGELRGGAVDFFRRRARRILPPCFAAVVFSLLLRWFVIRKEWYLYWPHFKQSLVANVLLVQDLLPRFNDIDPPLWSVAVEYKIYFLFPVLVLIWRRFGSGATLAAAAAVSGILMIGFQLLRPQLSLGHVCPWYLLLFSMGVCAGSVAMGPAQRRAWPWRWIVPLPLGLLALSLGKFPITAVGENARYLSHLPMIDVMMGALTACSLIVLTQSVKAAEKGAALTVLSWRPLVFVGTFAYSLYLTHFPVLLFLLSALDHVHFSATLAPYKFTLFNLVALPMILGCAYVFFVFFERPFLNSRSRTAIASPVNQVTPS